MVATVLTPTASYVDTDHGRTVRTYLVDYDGASPLDRNDFQLQGYVAEPGHDLVMMLFADPQPDEATLLSGGGYNDALLANAHNDDGWEAGADGTVTGVVPPGVYTLVLAGVPLSALYVAPAKLPPNFEASGASAVLMENPAPYPLPTGNSHRINKLLHVGFNPRQALFLEDAPEAPTFRELLLAGMSPRQARTWLRGDHSLDALIRGGFTKAQAVVLIEA